MIGRGYFVGALASTVLVLAGGGTAYAAIPCTGSPSTTSPLTVTVPGGATANGLYSLPAGAPKGIVAVEHGYGQTAASMIPIVEAIAQRDGVIAVAMDYRGTVHTTGNSSTGFPVSEGATDTIAATKYFDQNCTTTGPNVAFGFSMGGNVSGLAVAQHAARLNGAPLYDYWFDISGVTDPLETYADAVAVSQIPASVTGSIHDTAVQAKTDLETEMGGTPLTALPTFLARSPVTHASDMKASGLKGVVIAHGLLDGEVTVDQSVQMAAALLLAQIPTNIYTVLTKTPGDPSGTTLDGVLLSAVPGYQSEFAGHISPLVATQAFNQLDALYNSGVVPNGTSLSIADGSILNTTLSLLKLPTL